MDLLSTRARERRPICADQLQPGAGCGQRVMKGPGPTRTSCPGIFNNSNDKKSVLGGSVEEKQTHKQTKTNMEV